MTASLLLTALLLGLRHGFDWDHIAAIADLSGTAESRRHGLVLSLLYAAGHGVVVFTLGGLAIVAGATIPDGLDRWMGYLVGVTLIGLGIWIVVDLIRRGRDFRLRSRWMLVLDGTFAGLRAVRSKNGRRVIGVDHDHAHPHGGESHDELHAHDHAHVDAAAGVGEVAVEPAVAVPGGRLRSMFSQGRAQYRHSHRHHHELTLPASVGAGAPAPSTGSGLAAGIGMLHGVGVESPTQIGIFVASTSVAGVEVGLLLLLAWVAGLIVANMGLAVLAGLGLLSAERNFKVYVALALVVAVGSIAMGVLIIAGLDLLPDIAT